MTLTPEEAMEDQFPGQSDEEVAALARAFVLDEHCREVDETPDVPALNYET